ncbi:hypothetical protein Goshw_020870 [Gossypium schwendimanii]|uniref:DUF4283 domain-containing protein n=1 Tax=Gossypium schwendimanii TaxID=34291 RepID=A0A7J9KYK2_GOSSC|nr:hypothetical protein [Gossypium schwendimanii]
MENEIADLSISDGEEDVWQIMEDDEQMTSPHMFDLSSPLLHKLVDGEDPFSIPLVFTDFWVQILDLPYGLMMELEKERLYKCKNQFGCLKFVEIESFCPIRTVQGKKVMDMGWDISLRAVLRRAFTMTSCWLKDERAALSVGFRRTVWICPNGKAKRVWFRCYGKKNNGLNGKDGSLEFTNRKKRPRTILHDSIGIASKVCKDVFEEWYLMD